MEDTLEEEYENTNKVEEVFDLKTSRRQEKLRLKEEKRQRKQESKEQKELESFDSPKPAKDLPSWLRK